MKRSSILIRMIPIYIVIVAVLLAVALKGSQAITVYVESQPVKNRKCVIIDPGHGGVDGGATSCSGVYESHINLQIALRLDDLLHLLGIKTVLLRDGDYSIHTQGTTISQKKVSDLKERVRIVNESEQAILISIHQNHFSDSRYYGPQVFYGKGQGSDTLANQMQNTLNQSLCPESNRKIKSAQGIYLMEKISCPGILIECGFLSNPAEDRKLNTPKYQKNICCIIAANCSSYLNQENLS